MSAPLHRLLLPSATLGKLLTIITACLVLSGCMAWDRYGYIDLTQNTGLEVTSRGVPQNRNTYWTKAIPLSYEAQRDTYVLHAVVAEDILSPAMQYWATNGATRLTLKVLDKPYSSNPRRNLCVEGDDTEKFILQIISGQHCVRSPVLIFQIFDASGTMLGEEVLSYRVVPNGFWIVEDGI